MNNYTIRKALTKDCTEIHSLILEFAKDNIMLPRSLQYIIDHIRDFFVAIDITGSLCGTCAFSISQKDLAEVKSLAISKAHQKKGLASTLIQHGLSDLNQMGIYNYFCLTYVPDFFKTLGFTIIPKENLPHKIWTECINCPKFPNCDEIAMIREDKLDE